MFGAHHLAELSLWLGITGSVTAILDLLLSETQKRLFKSAMETVWIWLSYQRAGRFIAFLWNQRFQFFLVLAAFLSMLLLLIDFTARAYWGRALLPGHIDFQIGHPRLYRFQVIVDMAAVLIWMPVVAKRVHPRLVAWVSKPRSARAYFVRLLTVFGLALVLALLYVLVFVVPVYGSIDPFQNELAFRSAVEARLGGKAIAVTLHAISAAVTAPLMVELMIVNVALFLSLYWIVFIGVFMLLFRAAQFAILRITESSKGPVFAVSGFFIAVGGLVRLFAK